jgi:hypothetical protein
MSSNPDGLVYNTARNERLRRVTAAALALAQECRYTSTGLAFAQESLFATLSLARRCLAVDALILEQHLVVARYLAARMADVRTQRADVRLLEVRFQSLAENLAEEVADEYYGLGNDGTMLQCIMGHLIALAALLPIDTVGIGALVDGAIEALELADVEPVMATLEGEIHGAAR